MEEMEEQLEEVFRKFDLSEKEAGGIKMSKITLKSNLKECEISLVGKIIGEKVANYTGIKRFVNHVWGYPKDLKDWCRLEKVSELIKVKKWDLDVLKGNVNQDDIDIIARIPISIGDAKDRWIWRNTLDGNYSVKTGYVLAKEKIDRKYKENRRTADTSCNLERARGWKFLRSLNLKHKVKHFIWKCIHNIFPVKENINRRVQQGDNICCSCGREVESIEHCLFLCEAAEKIWKVAPISWEEIKNLKFSFSRWWEGLIGATDRKNGKEHICLTANILWQIWKKRNS
ncbi:hypothetical protein ACH5RR_015209 [Cinchona calisaya]|uniref:Reverse transcriptase zinc-binding domain-containing protein n=1 Tax=Cinchona calisaya TaxID=153742 RepID=A0ABD2ZVY8_9GENT